MRIIASKSEAVLLDGRKVDPLQVGGELLPQVGDLKDLEASFMSGVTKASERDRRISAVTWSLYHSVVVEDG